jgi:hypothetical protein
MYRIVVNVANRHTMDAKKVKARTDFARENVKWAGLAETDLWEKITEIILRAADAGLNGCFIGCLTNEEVIADLKKLGFTVEPDKGGQLIFWPH